MLGPEEAKEQLKQFENPNGYLEAGVRVSGFWSKLKDIGAGLLEGAERTYGGWNAENQAKWKAAKTAFEQLGDKDRLKLLNALFQVSVIMSMQAGRCRRKAPTMWAT